MILIIFSLILVLCIFMPQVWVRYIMGKYARDIPEMPGTGGELAEHLIERFELAGVKVERGGEQDNFYDPAQKKVSLSPKNYDGKSITAVAVAAHEIGHAIQFNRQERLSELRGKYLPTAVLLGKVGVSIMLAMPLAILIFKTPAAVAGLVAVSVVFQLAGAAMYLIVLPEEIDASFNKALPILEEGDYLPKHMLPAARKVLRAAAYTYFAAALANVVNIGRWLMVFLRR